MKSVMLCFNVIYCSLSVSLSALHRLHVTIENQGIKHRALRTYSRSIHWTHRVLYCIYIQYNTNIQYTAPMWLEVFCIVEIERTSNWLAPSLKETLCKSRMDEWTEAHTLHVTTWALTKAITKNSNVVCTTRKDNTIIISVWLHISNHMGPNANTINTHLISPWN